MIHNTQHTYDTFETAYKLIEREKNLIYTRKINFSENKRTETVGK